MDIKNEMHLDINYWHITLNNTEAAKEYEQFSANVKFIKYNEDEIAERFCIEFTKRNGS